MTDVCEGIAKTLGLEVDVDYVREYPATVNDTASASFVAGVIGDLFGEDRFELMEYPEAGSEDFSRVLEAVPGSYMMLGASVYDDYDKAPTNHSPLAQFDDAVMSRGALVHAELAIRSLANLSTGAEKITA
jgi:metal-dependent amidase/aminoacylase/carboxypeptidase family protein